MSLTRTNQSGQQHWVKRTRPGGPYWTITVVSLHTAHLTGRPAGALCSQTPVWSRLSSASCGYIVWQASPKAIPEKKPWWDCSVSRCGLPTSLEEHIAVWTWRGNPPHTTLLQHTCTHTHTQQQRNRWSLFLLMRWNHQTRVVYFCESLKVYGSAALVDGRWSSHHQVITIRYSLKTHKTSKKKKLLPEFVRDVMCFTGLSLMYTALKRSTSCLPDARLLKKTTMLDQRNTIARASQKHLKDSSSAGYEESIVLL